MAQVSRVRFTPEEDERIIKAVKYAEKHNLNITSTLVDLSKKLGRQNEQSALQRYYYLRKENGQDKVKKPEDLKLPKDPAEDLTTIKGKVLHVNANVPIYHLPFLLERLMAQGAGIHLTINVT